MATHPECTLVASEGIGLVYYDLPDLYSSIRKYPNYNLYLVYIYIYIKFTLVWNCLVQLGRRLFIFSRLLCC